MSDSPAVIDPSRPWILDKRDDPKMMNWIHILFNPMGQSSKLHFSRAWTFMFMGRVLLCIVPTFLVAIIGIAGVTTGSFNNPVNLGPLPVPAMLVPFGLFVCLTEYTSFVAHMRRLAEAGRSTLLAGIVLLPLIFGMVGFALGVTGGIAKHEQIGVKAALERGIAADPAKAAAARAQAEARAGENPQAKPQTEREMAIAGGVRIALPTWFLSSFIVMLWTLLYVARIPNGGVGEFGTGSHIPENKARRLPYETT